MIKPGNISRTSVLNLGYRWELQLFGIGCLMASNDLDGMDCEFGLLFSVVSFPVEG